MSSLYRITYSGQLMPGHSQQAVVTELARTFHMTEDEARELVINGAGRVIKQGLDAAQAQRYRDALIAVGLEILVDPPLEAQGLSLNKGPSLTVDAGGLVPQALPTGRGWGWIADAWVLFKGAPLSWIIAIVLFMAIIMLVGLIPWIGWIASTPISTILTGGLMLGARAQEQGDGFKIEHLFAGFSTRTGPLALLGVVYLLLALLLALVLVALMMLMLGGSGLMSPDAMSTPEQIESQVSTMTALPVLVALLFAIPMIMATYFAPVLVVLDGVGVIESLKLSFLGCLRNILPFLLYGLIAFVLLFVGALPLFLGWLIVVPVLTIVVYTAYRDIFPGTARN
ncbi:BPSS1780 family membrane protein [Caldichromatium japonicum]|nr:BPSS1780 family membrane protein [Caldichromatium japonicum]